MDVLIRSKNFWIMLATDICLILLAYYGSYFLRFEGQIPSYFFDVFEKTVLAVVGVKLVLFFIFDLYRGMWRYTSIADSLNVFKAVITSSVALVVIFLFVYGFQGFSRSVFVLDFILTLFFITGVRVGIRVFLARTRPFFASRFNHQEKWKMKKLLLIGAGDTGEKVIRELQERRDKRMKAVGILDDDLDKQAKSIHGVPILGNVDEIDRIEADFDEILITAPSASGAQMRRIVAACERSGKPFKTMPPLGELIDGRVSLKMVREVSLTDLLGREEVRLENREIEKYLLGKRVMVTGAGGSIGSELVRQISRFRPQALALVDVGEFNLYQVEMECRGKFRDMAVQPYLADLGDLLPTRRIFEDFRPDVVFHAAAYKHVPMQELHPWEAVYNNLQGMRNMIACSVATGVDKFVLVSSDKAVRPTNVMGATKRVCELMAACANGGKLGTEPLFPDGMAACAGAQEGQKSGSYAVRKLGKLGTEGLYRLMGVRSLKLAFLYFLSLTKGHTHA